MLKDVGAAPSVKEDSLDERDKASDKFNLGMRSWKKLHLTSLDCLPMMITAPLLH
jgi:hypothetical protein